ncbi:MAG: MBL fold metallo-hydrolase, partial [Mycobacterium sp.]|nr:MBL fold metallo-hydrolase [Mycobacterium sp.]
MTGTSELLAHPAYGRLRQVTDTASVLLADNPGLMTLEGTNTWVLRGPRSDEIVVVDPGPDDEEHIARVAGLGRIALVLISHRHGDHTEAIDKLVALTGAPVRSAGSGFLRGLSGELTDGEVIDAA